MTRQEIQDAILRIVNRADDTNAVQVVNDAFEVAHREIQRADMEWSGTMTFNRWETSTVIATKARTYIKFSDSALGEADPSFYPKKISFLALVSDTNSIIINTYEERTLLEVEQRYLRADQTDVLNIAPLETFRGAVFATYHDASDNLLDEFYVIWPTLEGSPTLTDTTKFFRMVYWSWLDPPELDSSDFFTINCADYLLYRTLEDLVPAFGLSDSLEKKWAQRKERALDTALRSDVGKRQSMPLKMRA